MNKLLTESKVNIINKYENQKKIMQMYVVNLKINICLTFNRRKICSLITSIVPI